MGLIFVDCEAYGGCPALGELTEFGAVAYPGKETFHGVLIQTEPSPENPAIPQAKASGNRFDATQVFTAFEQWLSKVSQGRPIFVSDNPAFDWQWINDGFLRNLGRNPFGHSARRLGDFYAGLRRDFRKSNDWKHLRVTPHDHHPVHDAMGNLEAFERMKAGEA